MRGEYNKFAFDHGALLELPPRARRIPLNDFTNLLDDGTTSACAENTQLCSKPFESHWNYLRVRGEYFVQFSEPHPQVELPPRARRIRFDLLPDGYISGTTSACAENTV